MYLKSKWFVLLLLAAGVVQAQDSQENSNEPVVVKHTKVSDIPAQYRSTAERPRKPFAVRYTCSDAGRIYVVFDNAQQTATLEMGNTTRYLKQGISASGARYVNSDESYVFWVKGKEATINGRETCVAD